MEHPWYRQQQWRAAIPSYKTEAENMYPLCTPLTSTPCCRGPYRHVRGSRSDGHDHRHATDFLSIKYTNVERVEPTSSSALADAQKKSQFARQNDQSRHYSAPLPGYSALLDDGPVPSTAGGRSLLSQAAHPIQADPGRAGGPFGWKAGLDGAAKILALSVSLDGGKRELLADIKDPFAHLKPKRLCWTVVYSGVIAAVPIVNDVVLDMADALEGKPAKRTSALANPGSKGGRRVGGGGGGGIFGPSGSQSSSSRAGWVVNSQGQLEWGALSERQEGDEGNEDDTEGQDLMLVVQRLLRKHLPWLTFRRAVHTLMVLSTQRFFEWKAVAHCSRRFADRLTKNIRLSAMRKRERMSRWLATYKIAYTARNALACQTLAIFLVDEVFLIVRLGWRERERRKNNPYQCTDWKAIGRDLSQQSGRNLKAAMLMWTAGTLGAMVGTLVWPYRTGSAMIITEQVANAVLL